MGKSKSANTITPAIATAAAKTKKEKSSGGAPLGDAVKPSSDNESSPLQPSSSWSKRALIARNINTGVYDVDSPNQSVFPAAAEEDELNTVYSAPRTKVTQQQQSKKESSSLSSRVGAKQQRTTTSTLSSSSLLLWSAIFVVIVAIVFSGNEDLTFTSKVGRGIYIQKKSRGVGERGKSLTKLLFRSGDYYYDNHL